MNDIIKAVILGILEGLTEFIPVSSTAHLIIVGKLLTFKHNNMATFDIAIQLGAILAVIIVYANHFKPFLKPRYWLSKNSQNIAIAIFPTLILGFLFHNTIKSLFTSKIVSITLFIGGIIMVLIDQTHKHKTQKETQQTITKKQALIIGILQCFCLIPGMSRSASTIIGGILAGLSYKTAAEFSFIIAVPVMTAAVSYDLIKTAPSLTTHDLTLIGIGFIVAFLVAWLSILFFLKILQKYKLTPFGIYRIILGGILLYNL